MARRKTPTQDATPDAARLVAPTQARTPLSADATPPAPPALRLLTVGADPALAAWAARAVGVTASRRVPCDLAPDAAAARRTLADDTHDVALLDMDSLGPSCFELARELSARSDAPRVVICTANPSFEAGILAIRSGAADFVVKGCPENELAQRLFAAAELAERARRHNRKLVRLKRICRRLNTARQDVNRQLDVLCNDLVNAYQELADQMSQVSLASEFSSLIRQELDVESLLRTTLEYLLTKTGPTNAAVFLPTGQSDYSLGAYVNYDMPKGTADVLLDHMADVVAPRFEDETDLVVLDNPKELDAWFGDQAAWLRDSSVLVFACRHDDEPLAIAMLFRDNRTPFPADVLPKLTLMRDLFAEQLARVIQVHNRHRPRDQWPGFEVDPGDDEGYGRGMAA